MRSPIVRGRSRKPKGPQPKRGEGKRATRLTPGERCACGGRANMELISNAGQTRAKACGTCAERAPLGTLIRPLAREMRRE